MLPSVEDYLTPSFTPGSVDGTMMSPRLDAGDRRTPLLPSGSINGATMFTRGPSSPTRCIINTETASGTEKERKDESRI
jgi:hypothetical protein